MYQLLHTVPGSGFSVTVTVPLTVDPLGGELSQTAAQPQSMLSDETRNTKKSI